MVTIKYKQDGPKGPRALTSSLLDLVIQTSITILDMLEEGFILKKCYQIWQL